MIKKDLVFAFRNLRRNKLIASINVLGLTIGISSCLVIFMIVNFEMSFDKFQPDRNRIYRVYSEFTGVFSGHNRGVPTGIATAIRDNFSGIDAVSNFHTFSGKVFVTELKGGRKDFGKAEKIIIAGPEYFKVFDHYDWIVGSADGSLGSPFQVVLSESKAKAYFGNIPFTQVMGREIHYRDSLVVTVSGIVKDVLEKTDLDFTEFISFSTIEKSWLKKNIQLENWGNTNSSSQLFIKADAKTSRTEIEKQLPKITEIYKEKNKDSDWTNSPALQSLEDLHFSEIGIFDSSRSVADKSALQVLMIIAFMLLIIASINFINLETAQASRRAKEVGVRKVLGSSRTKLVSHFLVESFILTCGAVVFSVGFAWLALQYFTDFVPQGLTLDLSNSSIILFLISCIVAVTLLAGLYPAFVLSSYQPALALKNLSSLTGSGSRSSFIRKGLTVFQFSFSQILIIATIAIGMQIDYMLNKDLGFETEAIVYFNTPWWEKGDKRFLLKNELTQIPEIEALSLHSDPPSSNGYSSSTMEFDNGKEKVKHNVYHKQGDTAYLRLYNIELLAGRNLLPSDTAKEYLINETYLHQLGFQNPHDVLGKVIAGKPIVGVVKDFHTASLHSPIEPVVIYDWEDNVSTFGFKIIAANQRAENIDRVMKKVEAAWKKIYPDEKFEYTFMDDTIKRFYENEKRTGKLARTATGIAILISCLGLFGLSSFTVIQRTKEIGIRKVLGATVNSIMILLSKDFLALVVIAFILSAPLAYYIADYWLKDFAYRTEISIWIFVVAGLSSVVTAFLTVSIRTMNAAKSDPVKSLRYE